MGVEGGVTVAVVDDHVIAVGVVVGGGDHLSALAGLNGGAAGGGDVDAGMAVGLAGDGVNAVAEQRGQPVVAGQRPQVVGLRVDGDIVLPALLLQLLLLPGDLRLDLRRALHLVVQLAVELRRVGIDLVQQLLGLRHLGLLLRLLGLLLVLGRLLLRAGALQLRLKPLQLLPGRGQLLHDLVVVVHHRVNVRQAVQHVGEVLGVEEDGPIGYRPLLLHGAHPLAEQLILGLLFGLRLPALRLFLGDFLVIVGDLRVDAVQLGIDCLQLLL
ncbi:Uncharacterised protein [Flavonifractor plautii]|uniref:Uncharacterized protein n=1 Tax=Flavonifractor plautii TaxID=292800 RepID=A0A174HWF7_FLAPL|nr:Uncharacterised protein [Flavonifractor plautii]